MTQAASGQGADAQKSPRSGEGDFMMADPFNLKRFIAAQAPVFGTALSELKMARKRSHWMWFVFLPCAVAISIFVRPVFSPLFRLEIRITKRIT